MCNSSLKRILVWFQHCMIADQRIIPLNNSGGYKHVNLFGTLRLRPPSVWHLTLCFPFSTWWGTDYLRPCGWTSDEMSGRRRAQDLSIFATSWIPKPPRRKPEPRGNLPSRTQDLQWSRRGERSVVIRVDAIIDSSFSTWVYKTCSTDWEPLTDLGTDPIIKVSNMNLNDSYI